MGSVVTRVGVDEVPEEVRALVTLSDVDYVDLHTITTDGAADRTPEEWARAALEEGALARRNARRLWRLVGLRLGPPGSPDHVQGWRIADRGPDRIRLETASWYLQGQVVCLVRDDQASISLALRYVVRPVARAVWALVAGPHQRAVPTMLEEAAALLVPPSPA
ncbi:MAG TPA: hypothetical protein VIL36_08775 [Acidimicrobiales bacterium]